MAIEALKNKPWYFGLGVGLGVAAVLFGLAWWRLYSPMKDQIRRQDGELEKLQAKIQEGRAAKQRLPQFREEVRRLELELDKLLRILPARLNTEDLLRRLRALAEQGDLELNKITPQNLTDRDFYSEWPIRIEMRGTYHNLGTFFDRIGRFSRIINVDDLVIEAIDPTRSAGQTIRSIFTARTFVYREEEAQPAEAEGARPPRGRRPPRGGGGDGE